MVASADELPARAARGPLGSRVGLRGFGRLPRAPAAAAASHRGAAAGRPARHGPAVRRARVLAAAAAPEGRRGEPVAGGLRRSGARRMTSAAAAVARAVGYTNAGHDRVPARRGRRVLLPRDEHAAAGRASGHRDGDRRGSGDLADPDRARRSADARPGGAARAARPRDRVPHLRRGSGQRVPALARPHRGAARAARARACATTAARTGAARCRSTTTR